MQRGPGQQAGFCHAVDVGAHERGVRGEVFFHTGGGGYAVVRGRSAGTSDLAFVAKGTTGGCMLICPGNFQDAITLTCKVMRQDKGAVTFCHTLQGAVNREPECSTPCSWKISAKGVQYALHLYALACPLTKACMSKNH
eukprot:scaffold142555_cov20-Tisochrysis_lutea.AAC.1